MFLALLGATPAASWRCQGITARPDTNPPPPPHSWWGRRAGKATSTGLGTRDSAGAPQPWLASKYWDFPGFLRWQ